MPSKWIMLRLINCIVHLLFYHNFLLDRGLGSLLLFHLLFKKNEVLLCCSFLIITHLHIFFIGECIIALWWLLRYVWLVRLFSILFLRVVINALNFKNSSLPILSINIFQGLIIHFDLVWNRSALCNNWFIPFNRTFLTLFGRQIIPWRCLSGTINVLIGI